MRKLFAALLALSSLPLAACSTLSVESDARDLQAAPGFARTLVVVLPDLDGKTSRSFDDTSRSEEKERRECEDALVNQLRGLNAFSSSDEFSSNQSGESPTEDALVEFARESGADGLVAMWLESSEEQIHDFDKSTFVIFPEGPDHPETVAYLPPKGPWVTVTFRARVLVVSVPDPRIRWTAVVRGLEDYPPANDAKKVAAAVARKLRSDAFLEVR